MNASGADDAAIDLANNDGSTAWPTIGFLLRSPDAVQIFVDAAKLCQPIETLLNPVLFIKNSTGMGRLVASL